MHVLELGTLIYLGRCQPSLIDSGIPNQGLFPNREPVAGRRPFRTGSWGSEPGIPRRGRFYGTTNQDVFGNLDANS